MVLKWGVGLRAVEAEEAKATAHNRAWRASRKADVSVHMCSCACMHANAGMPLPVSTVKYRVRVMCMLCMTHILVCSIMNAIDPIFLQMALSPSMWSETRRCRNLAGPEETPSVSYWL